ncbi:MAG: adenylate/guanylate cyclase domain-containing protein [Gammaproteobacteria bacterium]
MLTPRGFALEEEITLGWLFDLRGPLSAPAEVAVISMDRRSVEAFGQFKKIRDWPRFLHAELIDRLIHLRAAVIVFDVFFESPHGDDSLLVAAMARAGRVALFQNLTRERVGQAVLEKLINPTPGLFAAASGAGPFPLPKVPNRVDQFWTFAGSGNWMPTLPLVALQMLVLQSIPYADFVALLQAGGVRENLPSTVARPQELLQLMTELRSRFSEDSALAERLMMTARANALSNKGRDRLQALIKAYHGANTRFLNFFGPPATVRVYSYHEFWQDDAIKNLDLAGKVVFVGGLELSPEQPDRFYTVYSRGDGVDLSGVEVMATAFANLLGDSTIRSLGPGASLGVVLSFGIMLGILVYRSRGAYVVGVAVLAIILYLGLALLCFTRANLWLPLFTPLVLQAPLALMLGLLLQYLAARRERENAVQALLSRVPEKAAQRLIERSDPALPELIYGACVCSDVTGYAGLAERLPPQRLAMLTNEYFTLLGERIKRYQGQMLVIVGDGLTSLWSALHPARDVRLQACMAALEMLDAVEAFNHRHPEYQFPTRIGLHAGWVALGDIGGGGHYVYGVAGDIVNTASRIERLNKKLGTRLLAEHAVVTGLDELLLRCVGNFQVPSKMGALTVYEIVARRQDASSAEKWLCAEFASALALFVAQRWADAARRFEQLVNDYPQDGPCRFYLEYSLRYSAMPPPTHGSLIQFADK